MSRVTYFRISSIFLPNQKQVVKLNISIIDPKDICNLNQYFRNSDGNYNINLILYFKPQSYVYLGLTINGVTLFICIGYLIFIITKKDIAQLKN